jgi:hypothetical protein
LPQKTNFSSHIFRKETSGKVGAIGPWPNRKALSASDQK